MKNKKSFTLIEMLIVVVIIGILAAALIPRLQNVQGRARDVKRKVDLKQIADALEIYRLDNNIYPYPLGCINQDCANSSTTQAFRIPGLENILSSLPKDPVNTPQGVGYSVEGYVYTYGRVFRNPGNIYDLVTQLENRQDPDRCEIKQYTYYGNSASRCGPYSLQTYDAGPANFVK